MFGNQRSRLLREEQWTAQGLAEELYAMFAPDAQLEHSGPIIFYPTGDYPVIEVLGLEADDTVFDFGEFGKFNPALEQTEEDVTPATGGTSGGGSDSQSTSAEVIEGEITGIGTDTITVSAGSQSYTAKKPYTLRGSTSSGGGASFGSTGVQSRTATKGDFAENQVVIPPYEVGQTIYIASLGESGYIDLNTDGRAWCTKIPGDE